jgi:regulator of cell morphogenesis and NO signaling
METTVEGNVLNVAELQSGQQQPTIFAHFDKLEKGDILTIVNDHDPKPFYNDLLVERGNTFSWEYLEQGPKRWKVCIEKRSKSEADETLGQIAALDMQKVRVFRKYGLDFCCGGKKTVKEACAEKGLDVNQVLNELKYANRSLLTRPLPCNEWSLDFLCEYIVNTHHSYVRKTLPELAFYAKKVANVHGKQQPELIAISALVDKIALDMGTHMEKEEKIVFPYITSLVNPSRGNSFVDDAELGSIQQQSISIMEMEHEEVGNHLHEIKTLSNNYLLPENACGSYKFLFDLLKEFEEDLHMHIHLENNILFFKATELEKSKKCQN